MRVPSLAVFVLASAIAGCASGGGGGGIDARVEGPRDGGPADATAVDAPISTSCGNGVIEGVEECDGPELDGASCTSLGYQGGTLSCAADCTFDKSACVETACGNGSIDTGEECDGPELGGATCTGEGFVGGALGCGPGCTLDTTGCSSCGNGAIDAGEECDGAALGSATCASRGFTGGTLSCDATCGLDDSGCFDATCGDGVRGGSEDCDGSDLGGRGCADVGYFAGTLSCNGDCTLATSGCHRCGNGTIDGTEQCDGAALGGATCVSRGFTMGTLGCSSSCVYDTSGCSTAACGNGLIESGEACDDGNPIGGDGCTGCAVDSGYSCVGAPSSCSTICGDGQIRGGEQCDGSNLNGQTCVSQGFTSGTLRCGATCAFDTALCTSTTCGNSVVDTGEECDDGNTVSYDGCDSSCQVDANFHLPVRLRGGDGSNHGRLEIYLSGTWRDVCDDTYAAAQQQAMADVVCRQLGFTGTGHQFLNAFGGGSESPAMDDVQCTGTETSLAQCPFLGWNRENCSGSEAVGIRCMPGEGDIRLVGGPSGMEGRLQIYHSGAWGEVCDDYFDGAYGTSYHGYSTTTVCQQLGYRGGTFLSTYDAPGNTFVLDDVNCTGTERRIGDCPHLEWGSENCSASEGAGFRCDVHVEGDLRVREGTGRHSGRLEILHQDVWGTICDDGLEFSGTSQTNFVAVACGQLGFTRAGSGITSGFPDGTNPISMDNVSCAGSESALASCSFPGWRVHNCSHGEDMGLTCTP